jgi:predicted HicB family RNase H-like nuclease
VLLLGGKNSYESIKRYEDKAYDKVLVRFPKGKKDIIKTHAEAHSESVNSFINRAIDEAIERDESAPAVSEGQGEA